MTTAEPHSATLLVPTAASDGLILEVAAKDFIADGVCALTLTEPSGRLLPDWTPGSHIDVILPGQRVRQYSLCGDRWDPFNYRIAVLRESAGRGGSTYIHDELAVGRRLPIGGPRNNFAMVPARKYLFIAGGIGVTPLLPMIHQARLLEADWSLLYGGRCVQSMAFLAELATHGDRVTAWPADRNGPLDLDAALSALPEQTRVYCCGPAPLLSAVEQRCAAWAPGLLRVERFVPKPARARVRQTAFEVHLERSDVSVTVHPDTSLLDAIADVGVTILSSCRQGTCGTCETGVLSGVPDHRDSLLSDEERARNDCMFPCVSRSCSARIVLDL